MKYVVFMCHTIKILNSKWPRIRKFRQLLQAGKTVAFNLSPWSRVGHALRSIFMLWLVKIWQVSSCAKFMQHASWNLFTLTADAERVLCQLVIFQLSFSTGSTKWNTAAIKSLLLFMACLFIGFFVQKCVACQSRKSDFGWHRFRFSPRLMRERV